MKDYNGNEIVDGTNGFDISNPNLGWSVRNGTIVEHGKVVKFQPMEEYRTIWIGGGKMVDISDFRYIRYAREEFGDWWYEGSNDLKIWIRLEPISSE